MGNCLTTKPHSTFDPSLLLQLKTKTLEDITLCLRFLTEDYPEYQCIDYTQFEDVFAPLVDDPEPFFLLLQNEGDLEGVVDIYESLAVFAIFSKDKFEDKVSFIFKLFDFDHSNSLELQELVLTIQSVLRGLCKFVHIISPSHKPFEEEGKEIFRIVDTNQNGRISLEEFLAWIRHNKCLQDFLLKHAGILTYENLKARYIHEYTQYLCFFFLSKAPNTEGHAKPDALRKLIEGKEGLSVNRSNIDFLFEVLKNTTKAFSGGRAVEGEQLISKEAYDVVIKAWCVFQASDLNQDNILVVPELGMLLWLYEERKPDDNRVKYEMDQMRKKDQEGIELDDWMRNVCVVDDGGNYAVKPTLRKLFEKYDTDHSGYLSFEEVKEVFSGTFRDYIMRSSEEDLKKDIEGVLDGVTREVIRELDLSRGTSVSWKEFQRFLDISWATVDKLKGFLDVSLR